jgi:hypothetical protein
MIGVEGEVGRNREIRELTGDEDFRCKEKRNRSESTCVCGSAREGEV